MTGQGNHHLPCGCIMITFKGHVVNFQWCKEHLDEWAQKSAEEVARMDQEIEDAVFVGEVDFVGEAKK